MDIFDIALSTTHTAHAARVQDLSDLPQAVRDLGLPSPRPVIVPLGGAGGMTQSDLNRVRPLFDEALAPIADELSAVVVDGGTDAGIMRLMGEARATRNFPLVGAVAERLAALPPQPVTGNQTALEAHHTHFVLTPGSEWGAESIWISRLATVLAGTQPAVSVLINGGEIAYQDVAHSIEHRHPVIVVEGSGRTAEILAAALHGKVTDPRAAQLAASGMLSKVQLKSGPAALAAAIRNLLRKE